jgi:feruloyl esterase
MLTALLGIAIGCMPHVGFAQGAPDAQAHCEALVGQSFDGLPDAPTKITEATYLATEALAPADQKVFLRVGEAMGTPTSAAASLPARCRVRGYVAPSVRFEILLPGNASWNGKLLFATCDGFCGQMKPQYCFASLVRNYATVTTDGGHVGVPGFDGVWAYNNLQAEIDYGYRANHVVAVAAKAIIAAYFGRPPAFAYLTGCSKGGSAGVMAAMRYPLDFDGIIAGSPVLDYQGKVAIQFPWIAAAVTDPQDHVILGAAKAPAIQRAALAACDAADGLKDGLINDPRVCRFDPATLTCRDGKDDASCLTPAEVEALRKIYAEPRNSRGEVIYPAGTPVGSEAAWPGWILPFGTNVRTLTYMGAEQYLRYMAFNPDPGPTYDFRSFDFDRDPARLATMSPIFDATSPDLRAFKAHGGKLLIWHGWADAAISPLMTIRYYEDLTQFMGGSESTQQFARLMLLPGVFHCSGTATGASFFDALTAIEQWREHGVAPDSMLLSQDLDGDGVPDRTRPVFPYPLRAVYRGKGPIDRPESFKAAK